MNDAARCPICGSSRFQDFNRRALAMCSGCGAYERTRLAWLVIERLIAGADGLSAVHFAPEKGIAQRLRAICGDRYRAFDYDPTQYPLGFVTVEQLNLCDPIDAVAAGTQDLVVHNHILEHVPCNPWRVMHKLDALLKPGGLHVFSVPVVKDYYREDLDPALTPAQRTASFGQHDHMRMFGRKDLRAALAEEFGTDVHFTAMVDLDAAELEAAAVPVEVLDRISSHSVFVHRRSAAG